MKENLRNKGITLIALIITIIVLLLIAGITISTLMGDHGILRQANNAKVTSIEARVDEEIELAIQTANMAIRRKTAENNSWSAVENGIKPETEIAKTPASSLTDEATNGTVLAALAEDLKKDGYTIQVTAKDETGTRIITVEYAGGDYQKAKKDPNAKITKDIEVSQNVVALTNCRHNWDIATKDATCTEKGEKKSTCTKCGEVITEELPLAHTYNESGVCTKCGKVGIKSINIANMTLDGASLITVTLTNNKIATSSDVTFTSSNEAVATVTANGIVKCGQQTGTVAITCTAEDGTIETCNVTNTASKIVYTNSTANNTTIGGATTGFSYNQPVIPVGFSAIDTIDAKWKTTGEQTDYNKGLVIMDAKGNQFVWVPVYTNVDGKTVEYAKWCTTNFSHLSCSDGTLSDGSTIASVDTTTTYQGFWIGRYEAGMDVEMGSDAQLMVDQSKRNIIGTPIIVEGANPWNCIDYTNSRANAESLVNNSGVRSGLVNGTQWDTALKWIKTNTSLEVGDGGVSTAWGNYNTSAISSLNRYGELSTDNGRSWVANTATTNGTSQLLRTGASTETKALNISDLAGNVYEWSNEIYSSYHVYRGGSYLCDKSSHTRASCRNYYSVSNAGGDVRVQSRALHKVELIPGKGGLPPNKLNYFRILWV